MKRRKMSKWLVVVAAVFIGALSTDLHAKQPPKWPATPAGRMGEGWVKAFGAGEKEMRAFLGRVLLPSSLQERSMDERIGSYRKFRDRYRKLVLSSVEDSETEELEVILEDANHDSHRFVFSVRTGPPETLRSVKIVEGHSFWPFSH